MTTSARTTAMTLRLTPEESEALARLAEQRGVSRQNAAVAAILSEERRTVRRGRVLDAVDRVQRRDAGLLARLAE